MPRTKKPPAKQAREPLPRDAVLLTLDCSSVAIGWSCWVAGVLRAADVIRCPKRWPAGRRIRHNAQEAETLIDRYCVTVVLAESQSHKSAGPRVQGLATLGKAQYYMLALIEERHPGLTIEEVDERAWTRWQGRNMPKASRAEIVCRLVPLYGAAIRENQKADEGMDVADSLGLGLWRLGMIN